MNSNINKLRSLLANGFLEWVSNEVEWGGDEYLDLNSVYHEFFYYKTVALANKIYIVYIYKLKHSTISFFILHIELVNRNE